MKTIFIDVDGTLVFWPGKDPGVKTSTTTPEINTKLIEKIIEWKKQGNDIIVWSAAGKVHAKWVVGYVGIEKYVDYISAKPNIYVDDNFRWCDRIERIDPNNFR